MMMVIVTMNSIDRDGDGDDGDSCDDYGISWTILMIFIYDNDYAR